MSQNKIEICTECELGVVEKVKVSFKNGDEVHSVCPECHAINPKTIELNSNLDENNEEYQTVKDWGGYGDEEEEFDAAEFFGDAGDAAQSDIEAEFGKDEFTSFGSTENPNMLKDLNEKRILRTEIRKIIEESNIFQEEQEELEEERIANSKASSFVTNKENFIGSHIFGEDLGGLGKMYVAYSYGEQFPVYVWHKGKWYRNIDSYIHDGEIVKSTEKHKENMKPDSQTRGMSLKGMQKMIKKFMKKHDIEDVSHTEVEPGEKN